jgi:hypothetical protein
MNEMATEFGSLLCRGAVRLGVGGFRCYEQVPLQMLGLSAAALLLIAVVLTTKWLGKSAR